LKIHVIDVATTSAASENHDAPNANELPLDGWICNELLRIFLDDTISAQRPVRCALRTRLCVLGAMSDDECKRSKV
jgi:hypothetical protein